MVSAFTHGFSAVAVGAVFPRSKLPKRAWILGGVCAALPDVDYALHVAGVPYGNMFGHRGFTHSITFALLLAVLVVTLVRRTRWREWAGVALGAYLFVCTALHGVLDAMTDGGLGIAFFAPFSAKRYWLPWDPISVAPLSIEAFFTRWGWMVFKSELLWVWVPGLVIIAVAQAIRFRWNDQQ